MDTSYCLQADALQIPCRLTLPEDGNIQRLVLGVHGICGSAADAIQTSLAEEMSLFYSAVFRFDFPGHGQSPLDSSFFTVENCVKSLLAVARDARTHYPDVKDLCVFATGFGAYITLLALPELMRQSGDIRLVVHTPAVQMDETLLSMIGVSRETFRVMECVQFPVERPLDISYEFYHSLTKHSAMLPHPIPMLILQGEEDAYIRADHIRHFCGLNENSRLVTIPGTSHRFQEDGAWDMVLDLTRDWFEFEQVLLADWE